MLVRRDETHDDYSWPGNIREFKNAIERAMILVDNDRIDVAHLPIRISDPSSVSPMPRAPAILWFICHRKAPVSTRSKRTLWNRRSSIRTVTRPGPPNYSRSAGIRFDTR